MYMCTVEIGGYGKNYANPSYDLPIPRIEEELSLLSELSIILPENFLTCSNGQIIPYSERANGTTFCPSRAEYKASRIFFVRIVGHDYIPET